MMSSSGAPAEEVAAREIRQIIPTSGHLAVFYDEETGEPWVDQLVGWAFVVEKSPESAAQTSPRIIGLVSDGKEIVLADEVPNFLGYMSPGGGLEGWTEEAAKAFEESSNEQQDSEPADAVARRRPSLWQ